MARRRRGKGWKPVYGSGKYPHKKRQEMAEALSHLSKADRKRILDGMFGVVPQKKESSSTVSIHRNEHERPKSYWSRSWWD